MKNNLLFKIIGLLITVSVFFSITAVADFQDIAETKYESEIQVMKAFGLMEGNSEGMFEPDKLVSRAEFAVVLSRILSIDEVQYDKTALYDDVPEEHWAYGVITAVTQYGLFSGTSENRFEPENEVTYSQALKILVCMLGYEIPAENIGGYPFGFLSVANQIGLTGGLSVGANEKLSRGMVSKLVYNALTVDVMEIFRITGMQVRYRAVKDENVMSRYLGIRRITGIMTDNSFSALTGKSTLPKGSVEVDGLILDAAETDAAKYLGYVVECFVKTDKNNDELEIKLIRPMKNKNNFIEIISEKIMSADAHTLTYYDENGKVKSAPLADDADVIYNGMAYLQTTKADLTSANGSVKLLDSNNDGVYETIFIISEELFVVDSITRSTGKIYDKFTLKELELDSSSTEYDYYIWLDGTQVELEAVKEWDVLSVQRSKDNSLINVYVSDNVQTVMVDSVNNEEITSGEITHRFSQYYKTLIGEGKINKPQLGKSNLIYFDSRGYIAAINEEVIGERYGFLDKISANDGLMFDGKMKIFTDSGQMEVYDIAERLTLNDSKMTDREAVFSAALYNSATQKSIRQLITFEVNAANKIYSIHTATDKTAVEDYAGYTEREFTKDFFSAGSSFRAGSWMNFDFRRYRISRQNTTVFIVPGYEDAKEEHFFLKQGNYFQNNTSYKNISVYDATEAMCPRVIVLMSGSTEGLDVLEDGVENNSELVVVDEVGQTLNEDGESTYCLRAFTRNTAVEKILIDSDVKDEFGVLYSGYKDKLLKNLPKGSLIQYVTNARDEISSIRIVHIPGEAPYPYWSLSRGANQTSAIKNGNVQYYNNFYVTCAKVMKKFSDCLIINNTEEEAAANNYPIGVSDTTSIIIVDLSNTRTPVFIGTKDDVEVGDKIIIKTTWQSLGLTVVYK